MKGTPKDSKNRGRYLCNTSAVWLRHIPYAIFSSLLLLLVFCMHSYYWIVMRTTLASLALIPVWILSLTGWQWLLMDTWCPQPSFVPSPALALLTRPALALLTLSQAALRYISGKAKTKDCSQWTKWMRSSLHGRGRDSSHINAKCIISFVPMIRVRYLPYVIYQHRYNLCVSICKYKYFLGSKFSFLTHCLIPYISSG